MAQGNGKDNNVPSQEHPSLADFCTQLDDYTPTVKHMGGMNRIHVIPLVDT